MINNIISRISQPQHGRTRTLIVLLFLLFILPNFISWMLDLCTSLIILDEQTTDRIVYVRSRLPPKVVVPTPSDSTTIGGGGNNSNSDRFSLSSVLYEQFVSVFPSAGNTSLLESSSPFSLSSVSKAPPSPPPPLLKLSNWTHGLHLSETFTLTLFELNRIVQFTRPTEPFMHDVYRQRRQDPEIVVNDDWSIKRTLEPHIDGIITHHIVDEFGDVIVTFVTANHTHYARWYSSENVSTTRELLPNHPLVFSSSALVDIAWISKNATLLYSLEGDVYLFRTMSMLATPPPTAATSETFPLRPPINGTVYMNKVLGLHTCADGDHVFVFMYECHRRGRRGHRKVCGHSTLVDGVHYITSPYVHSKVPRYESHEHPNLVVAANSDNTMVCVCMSPFIVTIDERREYSPIEIVGMDRAYFTHATIDKDILVLADSLRTLLILQRTPKATVSWRVIGEHKIPVARLSLLHMRLINSSLVLALENGVVVSIDVVLADPLLLNDDSLMMYDNDEEMTSYSLWIVALITVFIGVFVQTIAVSRNRNPLRINRNVANNNDNNANNNVNNEALRLLNDALNRIDRVQQRMA